MTMNSWRVFLNHRYNAQLKTIVPQRTLGNGASTSALVVHCVEISRPKQFPVLNQKWSMEDATKSKEGLRVSGLKSSVLFSSSTVILRDLLRPLGCY